MIPSRTASAPMGSCSPRLAETSGPEASPPSLTFRRIPSEIPPSLILFAVESQSPGGALNGSGELQPGSAILRRPIGRDLRARAIDVHDA